MLNDKKLSKEEQVAHCQSWGDLFNLAIDVTKSEIHCATLAYFSGIFQDWDKEKGYGIALFKPIPFTTPQENYEIQAYFFNENSGKEHSEENPDGFENGKLYCIIFTDYNFKGSIDVKQQNYTSDTDTHSLSFGVVLNLK